MQDTTIKDSTTGIEISYSFNAPIAEEGGFEETFDKEKKLVTPGVVDLFYSSTEESEEVSDFITQIQISEIFYTLKEKAKYKPLDYLQKLKINGKTVWCIDNGEVITLLLPSEY